ncbi:adenine phosphoribosyltransferase [Acinetobacter cumulans]|jgi:adenine phosphoribosyltransferase|uniref:adenine phosphoribosyltransferase n=1 Tax=Acinetobacter cumulans TaxID=2136182 RepID=A0A3A8GS20_9GAMM|nr:MULTISPECIES: adenine phosphoribosyltransferase [Acinetobacter]NWK74575.1 adenine phosphoribosyltransferase [Acinetobacter sp. SwsAc6]QCO21487.1 adenine phosphoribosyltransferase [Acinetobacter cumulans]RFS27762.1 adenine phosphoribosyltransferase [Acinetobacter sp. SWAC5]RKG38784.1 adenine phosphoribosyltransferase [Acinetobacter cumulans]RKG45723.1 adenine phosphoribosyltransferase [Acinetobacter cumulans]
MSNSSTALWSHIRSVQDFPKPGICFFDLTPLFLTQVGPLTDALIASIPAEQLAAVDSFIAVEARGFVLASLLAQRTGKGLILVRKAGKLPPPVVGVGYSLEYGMDRLEMSAEIQAQKVIIVDDVLATGGTLKAVKQLAEKCNHEILGASIFLDLPDLHQDLGMKIWTVLDDKSKPEADAA